MEWISFFGPRRPINGQKVYYFGEYIGVWQGRYEIHWDDPVSEHILICEEDNELSNDILGVVKNIRSTTGLDIKESVSKAKSICTGIVDCMDAPWWQPYEGQPKPKRPETDYPKDYPHG